MADLLIKGMDMPKKCKDCRFWMLFLGRYLCFAQDVEVSNYTFEFMSQNRLPNCPLVEVKPHGRCIDADALAEYYDNLEADNGVYTEQAGETADTIRNAPTVLEASNGTDS